MSEIIVQLENANIYQSGNLILQEVNFTVQKGEFVYLVGRTGSGKSSLMKILYADLSPHSGLAEIAGFSLNNITKKDIPFLRRRLGIVFQDFQLLNDRTVNGNLKFVMRATGWKNEPEMIKRINELLEKIGRAHV